MTPHKFERFEELDKLMEAFFGLGNYAIGSGSGIDYIYVLTNEEPKKLPDLKEFNGRPLKYQWTGPIVVGPWGGR